jgi:membrane protease YdiL (CAAX protease family)
MAPLTLADHIIFGLIAFVLPLFIVWRRGGPEIKIPQVTALKIRLYWTNSLVLWVGGLTVIILWVVCGRSFIELGFRWPDPASFPHWLLIVALFVLLYFTDVLLSWHAETQHAAAGILPANWKEFWHFGTIVSISAGVCEELVFRGFFMLYLITLFNGNDSGVAIAIVGSAFVFGIAHEYQGGVALIKITLLSIIFAVLFVLTRSLVLVILLHFAVDFCSGLLAAVRHMSEARRTPAFPQS